jgi:hypothetical protein
LDVLVDIRHKTVHFLWGVPDQDRFKEFLHTIRLVLQIVISQRPWLQIQLA